MWSGSSSLVCLMLLVAPHAAAQPPEVVRPVPPPSIPRITQVAPPPQPVPDSLEAARRFALVILPAGPDIPPAARAVSHNLPGQVEASLRGEATKRRLSREELARLDSYVATIPVVLDEVILSVLPVTREYIARKVAETYNKEEAEGVATFFESPSGLAFWETMAGIAAEDAGEPTSDVDAQALAAFKGLEELGVEELKDLLAFTKTPGGIAFKRHEDRLDGIVAEQLSNAIQIPLMERLRKDACQKVSAKFCA